MSDNENLEEKSGTEELKQKQAVNIHDVPHFSPPVCMATAFMG